MLPKVSTLKAALEDQLHQNEIRSIPTEVVKPLEDELDVLKEKERLFRQVISGDFRNVSDMGEKAPLMKKLKEITNALTMLTTLMCAVRKQMAGA